MTTANSGITFPPRVVAVLRGFIRELPRDSTVKQELAGIYYDDGMTDEQLESLVGEAAADDFRVLKEQLDDELTDELAEEP